MAYDQKRLDTLIRQGMMPAKQLPILKRALEKLKGGQIPNPYEREAISKTKMIGTTRHTSNSSIQKYLENFQRS